MNEVVSWGSWSEHLGPDVRHVGAGAPHPAAATISADEASAREVHPRAGWQNPSGEPADDAVDLARAAAVAEASADLPDGASRGRRAPGEPRQRTPASVTHYFAAEQGGTGAGGWAVTLAVASDDDPATVERGRAAARRGRARRAGWVPWEQRVRPGDLGVGDLLPTSDDDPRLVPGYVASDDPVVDGGRAGDRAGARAGAVPARSRAGGRAVAGRSARSRLRHGPLRPRHLRHLRVLSAARGLAAGGVRGVRQRVRARRRRGVAVGLRLWRPTRTSASETASPVAVAELVYDDGVDLEPVE